MHTLNLRADQLEPGDALILYRSSRSRPVVTGLREAEPRFGEVMVEIEHRPGPGARGTWIVRADRAFVVERSRA